MKCSELSTILERISSCARLTEAEVGQLTAINNLLGTAGSKSVGLLLRDIGSVDSISAPSHERSVKLTLDWLFPAASLFRDYGKSAIANDLLLLVRFLDEHQRLDAESLFSAAIKKLSTRGSSAARTAPLRTALINDYSVKLRNALGNDAAFSSVFNELKDANVLTPAELNSLAKAFALASTRGRDAALRKIWSRHQEILVGQAKSAATAGRIAG